MSIEFDQKYIRTEIALKGWATRRKKAELKEAGDLALQDKFWIDKEGKEKEENTGFLLVITGASGAGKDSIMDDLLKDDIVNRIGIKRVVTCTDRPPRVNEIPGTSYHFVSPEELDEMGKEGKLAEPIVTTGASRKATPVKEIERLFANENLIWRIDPSRASDIASGEFFQRLFSKDAQILQDHTLILCVTSPKKVIEERRKKRDKDKYDKEEYLLRDSQEFPHLQILFEKAVKLENIDGKIDETVKEAIKIISDYYDSIKNQ